MTILETRELTKYYGTGENQVRALDGVDLKVQAGEFLAIVGTSGSGKSTLLHMLGGLDRPTGGRVEVEGRDIFSMKDEALTIFRRRKIGFVFQAYNLVSVLSVWENIVLPIQLDGGRPDEPYVRQVIELLGLEQKLDSLPNQLSGGQQQRVAIARALATKPAILLADEPTGNLDSRTSQDVLSLMKVTGRKYSQTMVMITHNEEIAQLADRVIRIEDGRIQGSPAGKGHGPEEGRAQDFPEDSEGLRRAQHHRHDGHRHDSHALHRHADHGRFRAGDGAAGYVPPGGRGFPRGLQAPHRGPDGRAAHGRADSGKRRPVRGGRAVRGAL